MKVQIWINLKTLFIDQKDEEDTEWILLKDRDDDDDLINDDSQNEEVSWKKVRQNCKKFSFNFLKKLGIPRLFKFWNNSVNNTDIRSVALKSNLLII